jgi:hypothetical protein
MAATWTANEVPPVAIAAAVVAIMVVVLFFIQFQSDILFKLLFGLV